MRRGKYERVDGRPAPSGAALAPEAAPERQAPSRR